MIIKHSKGSVICHVVDPGLRDDENMRILLMKNANNWRAGSRDVSFEFFPRFFI